MKYVVELFQSAVWPVVALIVFFKLLDPVKRLISGIEELVFHYKEFQASAKVNRKNVEQVRIPKPDREAIAGEQVSDQGQESSLSKDARKVMATLYDGQFRHYGEAGISKGQWSFRVLPNSSLYGNFLIGFAELLEKGLAGWERKHGQAVLTQSGWEYAKGRSEISDAEDIYGF